MTSGHSPDNKDEISEQLFQRSNTNFLDFDLEQQTVTAL